MDYFTDFRGGGGSSYLDVHSLETFVREASNILSVIFFAIFRPFAVKLADDIFNFNFNYRLRKPYNFCMSISSYKAD